MIRLLLRYLIVLCSAALLLSCSQHNPERDHGIYMLLDTSGTYAKELETAQQIINTILARMKPGDTFAVQRIDTGSFSEKDIIYSKTFDMRPSKANEQRRIFKVKVEEFIRGVQASPYTDITGGILQGVEFLNEAGPGKKTILIFSDMKEDLRKGYNRDLTLSLSGFTVIAINVTKLRSDNLNPQEYLDRLAEWRRKVESGGGAWRTINDLDRLEPVFEANPL